jgi:hypothetical protein
MDERIEKRYPASLDISLTGLTDPTQSCHGRVADISRYGLCVVLPMRFTPGALVKLAFADSTLFGYVVYANPEEAAFRCGIEVERVLLGETPLARLLRGILKEEMPQVPGLQPATP